MRSARAVASASKSGRLTLWRASSTGLELFGLRAVKTISSNGGDAVNRRVRGVRGLVRECDRLPSDVLAPPERGDRVIRWLRPRHGVDDDQHGATDALQSKRRAPRVTRVELDLKRGVSAGARCEEKSDDHAIEE